VRKKFENRNAQRKQRRQRGASQGSCDVMGLTCSPAVADQFEGSSHSVRVLLPFVSIPVLPLSQLLNVVCRVFNEVLLSGLDLLHCLSILGESERNRTGFVADMKINVINNRSAIVVSRIHCV